VRSRYAKGMIYLKEGFPFFGKAYHLSAQEALPINCIPLLPEHLTARGTSPLDIPSNE
jgi:hypothetical protein